MIAVIDQVSCGGALSIVLQPMDGATLYRVTRGASADVLVDENAGLLYEGTALAFLDGPGLVNGTPLWYRAFYLVGGAWVATPAVTQTPVASFADYSVDVLGCLKDRIADGLAQYVARGVLKPKRGSIPCLVGTPELDQVGFPVVIFHVDKDGSGARALGERMAIDETGEEFEGWLSDWSISFAALSMNYDERKALRQAIKAIVIANLRIFDAAGIVTPALTLSDRDDVESMSAPLYSVAGTFTCQAMSLVGEDRPVVVDVEVNATAIGG